jgi:ubiquitin C-terminal hydrolase
MLLQTQREGCNRAVQCASAARNALVAAQGALVAAQRAEKSAIAAEEKPMKVLWAGTSSNAPVGLMNVGNTCYFAAVLQALCASVNVDACAGVEVLCTDGAFV